MTKATVLIPTHDHGPTLFYSVQSALAQSVRDLEVLIVGDGVPDVTREIADELMKRDERVRFFDNPKGPRHGEVLRHAALQEATGEIVCYLSDDDLWLPTHIATMGELLAEADFAHTLPLYIDPSGAIGGWIIDLKLPFYRELLLSGENRIPLSCGAHTLASYLSLSYGWRTTPEHIPTDLYMWQQFLAEPSCRVASGHQPTALHFSSLTRTHLTVDQRAGELNEWVKKLGGVEWRLALRERVLDFVSHDRAQTEVAKQEAVTHLSAEKATLELQISQIVSDNATLIQKNAAQENKNNALLDQASENRSLRAELSTIYSLPSWRLRNHLLRLPLVGPMLQWVGRVLAG